MKEIPCSQNNTKPLLKFASPSELEGTASVEQLGLKLSKDEGIRATPQFTTEECKKRSIGFIRRGYSTTGGAEAYLKRLAQGLLEKGYRVLLLGTGHWPQEEWPGGETIELPCSSLSQFAKAALDFKNKESIDLLFSMERIPGCDIFRAGDGLHAAWLEYRGKQQSFLKRWSASWMPRHRQILKLERLLFSLGSKTHVIANSAMVAEEIHRIFRFPKNQIAIIPNGVPQFKALTLKEREAARDFFGMDQKECVLLFVGTGWKRKGLGTAIAAFEEAFQELQKKGVAPKLRLWIAGKGPSKKYRSPLVRFLGSVKKIGLLYGTADLFILPTLYDPFSNASLEALASGIPVITSAKNGCSEIITEGVHGSVVEDPTDITGFANVIVKWYELWNQKEEMALTRLTCAQKGAEFTMEKNLESTLCVIEHVLENKFIF